MAVNHQQQKLSVIGLTPSRELTGSALKEKLPGRPKILETTVEQIHV